MPRVGELLCSVRYRPIICPFFWTPYYSVHCSLCYAVRFSLHYCPFFRTPNNWPSYTRDELRYDYVDEYTSCIKWIIYSWAVHYQAIICTTSFYFDISDSLSMQFHVTFRSRKAVPLFMLGAIEIVEKRYSGRIKRPEYKKASYLRSGKMDSNLQYIGDREKLNNTGKYCVQKYGQKIGQ